MDTTSFRFSLSQGFVSIVLAYFAYACTRAFYNVTLHPLAKFPGPKLRGAFYFPQYYEMFHGTLLYNRHKLHEVYGDFVRVAPNLISVINPDGWKDIYGQGNKQPLEKDIVFYGRKFDETGDLLTANREHHPRMRRLLNHAFSEQALRAQEGIINSYVTLMISKLHKYADTSASVDIMKYLNFVTFDVTGDLSFDESFGSLESEDYNHWISNIFEALTMGVILRISQAYGAPVDKIFDIIPPLRRMRDTHKNYTMEKTARRMESTTERKDFMSYILQHNDERGMSQIEIMKTSGVLVIAGSETSATLLSGAVFYLLKNPAWLAKLQQEIRSAFATEESITFSALSQLKILHVIILETFRMYPPVPLALPRVTPDGGIFVAGKYVPSNTIIGVTQYCAYRSSHNFKDPDTFDPNRWLGDEKYANDRRAVLQPFSVGPRNCIGQPLAWAELRVILTRLIWNFDMELLDESRDWDQQQKVYVLWKKPGLMVRLTTAKGNA